MRQTIINLLMNECFKVLIIIQKQKRRVTKARARVCTENI